MRYTEDEGPRRRTSVSNLENSVVSTSQREQLHISDTTMVATLPGRTHGRKMVSATAVTILLLAIILLWNSATHTRQLPAIGSSAQHAEKRMVGITLHPEDHAYRDPQNITLSWTISTGLRSPDGVKKRVYLVNGMFPGPTIEARTGDELTIHVQNDLETEGVAIHWHGLQVPNEMDGAVGYTQCPISPGANFTYRFKIGGQHGTFWWHAHFQTQRGDGLYGGFVIHEPQLGDASDGPRPETYDRDVLLLVGDWFHRSSDAVLDWYTSPGAFGNEPVPDSLLINGFGRFDCGMAVAARPVDCSHISESTFGTILSSAETTRIRLINVGTIAGFSPAVDDASLQAISVDGGSSILAQPALSIGAIYPGERVDAILRWLKPKISDSRLHINLDPENFRYTNPSLNVNQSFPMTYPSAKISHAEGPSSQPLASLDLAASRAPTAPTDAWPAESHHTILLYVKTQKLSRFKNRPRGFINHTSWAPQTPPLQSLPRSDWDDNQLVSYIPVSEPRTPTSLDTPVWVDIIINNLDDGSHPFHLHGNSFYVLSSYRAERVGGWGSWNKYSGQPAPGGLNLETPVLKDTVSVPRRGHVVLRFKAKSPGLWMLHCHMLVHLGSGMATGIHVGLVGDEAHQMQMNKNAAALCD
ncbi:putative Iron transport multicopper oxidase FET3 [Seiridium cardinale]|uniref:Iron transport multicopper oxidase FET3 n=1 Tax=Seiridium cardinale TaxID=138064 RepID=A0ABR2XXT3_9PEZI